MINLIDTRLTCREMEIMQLFYLLGEATPADIEERSCGFRHNLPMAMLLDILERKGCLTHRYEGALSLYAPVHVPEIVKQPLGVRMLNTLRTIPQAITRLRKRGDISDVELNKLTKPIRSGAKMCVR